MTKKYHKFILLLLGIMSLMYANHKAKSALPAKSICDTKWIVDSLNIRIGISNCYTDLNRYELVLIAKEYTPDTIQTKFYELGEISFIDVIDSLSLVKSRFILKDGTIAIPVKSFNGLKICFVDLMSNGAKKNLNKQPIWTDKTMVYNLRSSIFTCEYEARSSRNYTFKEFVWKGDSISLLKQW